MCDDARDLPQPDPALPAAAPEADESGDPDQYLWGV